MSSSAMLNIRSLTLLSLASSALAAGTLDFAIRKQVKPQLKPRFDRRDAFDTSVFTDDGSAYYLNISVGSPGQLQTVSLDTGSSDLFVTSSTAPFCQNNTCVGGTFDASKSSTFQVVTPGAFDITFGDGTTDDGDLVSDVVQIRDRVITNVTLGLAYNVNPSNGIQEGLLGLGYSLRESSVLTNGIQYPNFVETLVNAGAIASRFYSLYLSNLGQYGSIIFGGVDTQKFEGNLVTLNCYPARNFTSSFQLTMSNVTMVDGNGTTIQLISRNNTQTGFFDSGATAWNVAEATYIRIVDVNPSGKQYCALLVSPSPTNSGNAWGDAIMRAGYFVYDLDNNQVSVGQARYSDESNIVAVQAGPHGLANAINQPRYAQTAQTNPPVPFATDLSRKASVFTISSTIGVATGSTAVSLGNSGSITLKSATFSSRTSSPAGSSASKTSSSLDGLSTRTVANAPTTSKSSLTPSQTNSYESSSSCTLDTWYPSTTASMDDIAALRARVAELEEQIKGCGCYW
ncbi:unnamed protein product [Aureobasidium uvarum]|uniref:Peptidase A1 domain-containing protein n=1 Tax=Aureobasidium uvarum TaxID=2773716 RepID=A0A9N8KQS1_9PEZI|nr:unnamed protein product [Aureobasidium uvarum]